MRLRNFPHGLVWLAIGLLILSSYRQVAAAPHISAEAALVLDASSGEVLYAKNAGQRMYPASTTKIMTAVVSLERARLGETVPVSRAATQVIGTSARLRPGELISVEGLLYGLILRSGNDAAIALAEHIAGGEVEFAELMNRKARELNLRDTHFVNPHGLHSMHHYTTAADLAAIARYALRNPTFRRIAATKTVTINDHFYKNHNRLLWSYPGADGIKVGFTSEAGKTFVASAGRGDREIIVVLLNDPDLWHDAVKLLDYGFAARPRTSPL